MLRQALGEGASPAQERERAGLPGTCSSGGCDAKPMPLSHYCFAHILQDPQQVLYGAGADGMEDEDDEDAALPVMCTEDLPLPPDIAAAEGDVGGAGAGGRGGVGGGVGGGFYQFS